MKKENRFLALLLSITLCLSLLPARVFAAEESGTLVIQATSVSGDPGQTVEVPIVITQNPGVVAFGVQIEYDSTKLTLIQKPTIGDVMGGTITQSQYLTSNPYMVLFDSSTASANITATGTLMTMSFLIKEDASAGEISINVSFATNSRPINFDLKDVPCSGETGTVTVKEHIWGDVDYTWSVDNTTCTAERSCICGGKETENGTVTSDVIAATCTDAGFVIYTAVFMNPAFETQMQAIAGEDAAGHGWGEAIYAWNTDNTVCTAEHSCACGAKERENATVSSMVTDATCTEAGKTVYTAVFTNSAFEEQEKTVVGTSAKGHAWGAWETIKEPTTDQPGEARRVCNWDETHVETRSIAAQVCFHACTLCGRCTAEACFSLPKCTCGEESCSLETKPLEEHQISVDTSDMMVPGGQTVQVIANEVILPSMDGNEVQSTVNPYEEHILDKIDGYVVEKVYEISLQVEETGKEYWLVEGETAAIRLFVGAENAQAIDEGAMFLVHLSADGTEIYSKDQIQAELQYGSYTGYISFSTDGFSPFLLVSKPAELSVELNASATASGCNVEIKANRSFNCDLYLAAYDADGHMLGAKVVSNCNLGAYPRYTMHYEGVAATVKAFMTESGTFTPRCIEAKDENVGD